MNPRTPPLRRIAKSLARLLGAVAIGAAVLVFAQAVGADGRSLRWRFEGVRAYVYRVTSESPLPRIFGGQSTRGIAATDLVDGRALRETPFSLDGVVRALVFHLPADAVSARSKWPIRESAGVVFNTGPGGRAVESLIEGSGVVVADKGSTIEMRQTVRVHPSMVGAVVVDHVDLAIESVFDVDQGAISIASFRASWAQTKEIATTSYAGRIERVRALRADVARDAAESMERGAASLRAALQARKGGYWESAPLGMVSLALFALERAGDDPGAPHMRAGFDALGKLVAGEAKISSREGSTYAVSLAILAIEGRSVKRVAPPVGGTQVRYERAGVDPADLALLRKLVGWLGAGRLPSGAWSYMSPAVAGGAMFSGTGDFSNTQLAILALHAALRAGVPVRPQVMGEIATMLVTTQASADTRGVTFTATWDPGAAPAAGVGTVRHPRGFGYVPMKPPTIGAYTSMTAAGVASLMICRDALVAAKAYKGDDAKRIEDGISDGLAWLQANYAMDTSLEPGMWFCYTQYALEKALEIGRVATIGGHDWWSDGATQLLVREEWKSAATREAPGAVTLTGRWGDDAETSFALLFLTRASIEPEIHVRQLGREASGGSDDEDAIDVPGVGVVSAREVLAAADASSADVRRDRIALAEKMFDAMPSDARPRLAPALGKLLSSKHPDAVKLATRLLAAMAGGKVADEKAAVAFFARWDEARKLGLLGELSGEPRLQELLRDPLTGVRRAAALGLARAGALDAIPDLVRELSSDDRDYRGYARSVLSGMLGADPGFDDARRDASIKRWQRAWDERKDDLLRRVAVRADIDALASPAERDAARARLVAAGRPAVRALIDALSREPLREQVGSVLEEVTGEAFGTDKESWERWWAGGK